MQGVPSRFADEPEVEVSMGDHLLRRSVSSRELASRLGIDHGGADVRIRGVASAAKLRPGFLAWRGRSDAPFHAPAGSALISLRAPKVEGAPTTNDHRVAWLSTPLPRLGFARALLELEELGGGYAPKADKQTGAHPLLRSDIALGDHNIHVGRGAEVGSAVHIASDVRIGEDVRVGPAAVIGDDGFSFECGPDGAPIEMIHLAGVLVGDRVWIGAGATITRGALEDTIIGDDAKIGAGASIGQGSTVGAGAVVGPHVVVGEEVVIGPGARLEPGVIVRSRVFVAALSLVGAGSVVVTDVAPGGEYFGNPARPVRGGPR